MNPTPGSQFLSYTKRLKYDLAIIAFWTIPIYYIYPHISWPPQDMGSMLQAPTWLLTTTWMVPCVLYAGRSLKWKVSYTTPCPENAASPCSSIDITYKAITQLVNICIIVLHQQSEHKKCLHIQLKCFYLVVQARSHTRHYFFNLRIGIVFIFVDYHWWQFFFYDTFGGANTWWNYVNCWLTFLPSVSPM